MEHMKERETKQLTKMKKIMFNDKYGLTKAVLERRKTNTRREEQVFRYRVGEVIAIAQSYSSIIRELEDSKKVSCMENFKQQLLMYHIMEDHPGFTNKMFVQSDLMLHQIKVTNMRREKLQDISDEDCIKEGVVKYGENGKFLVKGIEELIPHGNAIAQQVAYYYEEVLFSSAKEAFSALIDKVCGKGTWKNNRYVTVYEFELIK